MQVCVVALPRFLCVKEGIWNDYADAGRRVFKVLECGHVVMERVTFAPNKNQAFPDLPVLPKDRFAKIIERGVKPVACGVCVRARGQKGDDYIEGVTVGGLPDFAEIIGEVDQLITL